MEQTRGPQVIHVPSPTGEDARVLHAQDGRPGEPPDHGASPGEAVRRVLPAAAKTPATMLW